MIYSQNSLTNVDYCKNVTLSQRKISVRFNNEMQDVVFIERNRKPFLRCVDR
jgi:hypothetical protein